MENKIKKIESTELIKVVENAGLAIQEGEEIKQSYQPFLNELADIQEQATKINFDNPVTIDETIARELRLKTVKIRTGAAEIKENRKRIYLLKGNLEQAAYNLIAASCKLTEEAFVKVEKSREIAEKKRKEKLKAERLEILSPLCDNASIYPLSEIDEEAFNDLVNGFKLSLEKKAQEEAKALSDKLAKEKAEREEQERIRLENEKLKSEAIEKERIAEIERKKQQELLIEQKKKAEAEAKRQAEILAKQKAESDAKLKKEREEKEKLEAELRKKSEAEAKEKLRIENENKAKLLAEKKEASLSDFKKLIEWVDGIKATYEIKGELSNDAEIIANTIIEKFSSFKNWAKTEINKLKK